jgi:hypothetical protein
MSLKFTRKLTNMIMQDMYQFKEVCDENLNIITNLNTRRLYLLQLYPNLNVHQNSIKNLLSEYELFIKLKTNCRNDISTFDKPPIDLLENYLKIYKHDLELQNLIIQKLKTWYKQNGKLPFRN